jgi:YbbR domain-containing protein
MVQKTSSKDENKTVLSKKDLDNVDKLIEEVDLDSIDIEETKTTFVSDALQRDSKGCKIPIDREDDKRRI